MKPYKFNTITGDVFNGQKEYFFRRTIDASDRKEARKAIMRLGYSEEIRDHQLYYVKK